MTRGRRDPVPWAVWLMCLGVALLRAVPYVATRLAVPEPGTSLPPVPYNPKDWLAYVAFVRQAAADASLFLFNPFTTEPQHGRYLLLFHQAVGLVARWTGLDPFFAFELSRIPALLLFFAALWRVACSVLPERRDRMLACSLVAFGGGIEVLAWIGIPWLPPRVQHVVGQNLSPLLGWSTFAAAYNPVWMIGTALNLALIAPFVSPTGLSSWRDAGVLAIGIPLLAWVHPYSLIAVLAVVVVRCALGVMCGQALVGMRLVFAACAPAVALVFIVASWQREDAVFAATADEMFGRQAVSAFWYPIALGALGFFAFQGWRRRLHESDPASVGLLAWTFAIAMLHMSPVLNGYHFVSYLHVPVCLAAAPALALTWQRARDHHHGRIGLIVAAALLFNAPLSHTVIAVNWAASETIPADWMRLVERLRGERPGQILATAEVATWIPAYTEHRVFAGQWFLTPDYERRAHRAAMLTGPRASAEELRDVVASDRITYIVANVSVEPVLARMLAPRVTRTVNVGSLAVLFLAADEQLPAFAAGPGYDQTSAARP
jgi:hypothetical protein